MVDSSKTPKIRKMRQEGRRVKGLGKASSLASPCIGVC